ncbi:hypothetical protein QL285_001040 [Trifolium repens]|nr:hypothetical protein QL285_001040 [Trifolium repens]
MRLTRSYGKSAASDFYLFLPWHHINTATPIHLLHHHHRFYTNPLKIFFHGINKKQSVHVVVAAAIFANTVAQWRFRHRHQWWP